MKAPRRYGVYRLRDSDGRLLYVGASVSPRIRQSVHRSTRPWGKDVDPGRLTVDWYETEAEAAAAELEAIATEAPLHNRRGADWKMIPYRYDRFQPKMRPPEVMSEVEMAIQDIGRRRREDCRAVGADEVMAAIRAGAEAGLTDSRIGSLIFMVPIGVRMMLGK